MMADEIVIKELRATIYYSTIGQDGRLLSQLSEGKGILLYLVLVHHGELSLKLS